MPFRVPCDGGNDEGTTTARSTGRQLSHSIPAYGLRLCEGLFCLPEVNEASVRRRETATVEAQTRRGDAVHRRHVGPSGGPPVRGRKSGWGVALEL